MNANLLNIVKRIVAEQGENILGDSQRLKPFISDYASAEPKEDRVAFGRAIEQGFYMELKRATSADRGRVKTALLPRLQQASGYDAARCTAAIDLLEAAMTPATSSQTQNSVMGSPAAESDKEKPHVSKRTLLFAIAAFVGALAGEVASNITIRGMFSNPVVSVGFWAAFIGMGISVGLIVMQTFYLKKKLAALAVIKSALLGIGIGMAGGAVAQIIFGQTYHISTVAEIVSRIICWGILGWGLGFGVSFYVPNFPKRRAMFAGLIGGIIGGAIFRALITLPDPAGRIMGVSIMGLTIGLTISWVEETLREAWITVIWGPKETRTIALGQKPIIFGSAQEADVYLPQKAGNAVSLGVRAVISMKNDEVIFEDKANNRRSVMKNGDEITIDKLRVAISTKQ